MTRCATTPAVSVRTRTLEPGAQAHCKRVAAWCEELALALGLSEVDTSALHEAALMHHHPTAFLQGSGFSRLANDLRFFADENESAAPRMISAQAEQILLALRGKARESISRQSFELASLLETANCFDEQLEFAPFEAESLEVVLQRSLERNEPDARVIQFVLRYLRKTRRSALSGVMGRLPVYPMVAIKLYTLLSQDDVSLGTLDRAAKSDQVIAGKLLQAANSAFYSPRQLIKTVSQAISYVGISDSRQILLASAVQPLYASPRLKNIWRHAVEAAQVAEQIALMSQKVDAAEAFLTGLLHDVGKLALALLPADVIASVDRLTAKGCEPALAELVVCGFDHSEAGADVLRHWKFSDEMIDAVRYHHVPERGNTPMSAVLYLTEFWTDSEEDIPSNSRLDQAFERAGITPEDLSKTKFQFNQALFGI